MRNFESLSDIKDEIRKTELQKAIAAEKLKLNYNLMKRQLSVGQLTEDIGFHIGQKIVRSVIEKIS